MSQRFCYNKKTREVWVECDVYGKLTPATEEDAEKVRTYIEQEIGIPIKPGESVTLRISGGEWIPAGIK